MSDHSSRYEDQNGHVGGRYEERNGRAGGRYEERNGHAGGRYEERDGGRVRGRIRGRSNRDDYSDDERSRKSSTHSSHHTNGGYKHSDESNQYSDHDTDVEEKRKYFEDQEDEEESPRNSFTPVKFKPRLEKELDSIRIKEMNTGTVDYIRRQDETPSVDFSDDGRHISRSMSSFSQPGDSEAPTPTRPGPQKSYLRNIDDERAPTPPAPLPLNIPAKFNTRSDSDSSSSRPVPAPRPPKPMPTSRSKENIMSGSQDKLNNLSQDESVRASHERLDDVDATRDRYGFKKTSSREDLSEPFKYADLNARSGVDYLPKHNIDDLESGRDSPLHQSRENLLPKELETTDYSYGRDDTRKKPENRYRQDMFEPNVNSSKEHLYPRKEYDSGTDYLGRETPQQMEFSDSAGIDYLPRQTGTSVDKKYGSNYPSSYSPGPKSWNQPSASPGYKSPGYQPGTAYNYTPTPSPGYQRNPNQSYQPGYPSETNIDSDYSAGEAGIDYLPKSGNQFRGVPYHSGPRDNISRSRENLSRSRENVTRSRENLSRSRENLSRSRENLSRSKDNLRHENDYSPAVSRSTYDSEILENSSDIKKPKQYKSIETEI